MALRKYSYYDFYYEPTHPIEVDDGIKARNQRGAFAKNWWATRWIQAIERLVDSRRLARGRNYARKGQVHSIEEGRCGIRARRDRAPARTRSRPKSPRLATRNGKK